MKTETLTSWQKFGMLLIAAVVAVYAARHTVTANWNVFYKCEDNTKDSLVSTVQEDAAVMYSSAATAAIDRCMSEAKFDFVGQADLTCLERRTADCYARRYSSF